MRFPFLFFTLFLVFTSLFSQEAKKELTLKDAVLGYYKGLYPDNLYGLDWTSTNSLYKKEKDALVLYQPTKKGAKKLDNSWNVISNLSKENTNIKGISFRRNYGKSVYHP